MEQILVLAVIVGASVAIWTFSRPKRRARGVAGLKRELSHLTHDAASARRLVEAEQQRFPDATEKELLERVIRKLRYERRR